MVSGHSSIVRLIKRRPVARHALSLLMAAFHANCRLHKDNYNSYCAFI
jgi:hypothetical protein